MVTRRDEQVVTTRARILTAARDTIVATGYHAASLDQIAAAAGVTRVTVYRQYGNKQGVLDALVDAIAARSDVVALVAASDAAPDTLDALAGLVEALGRLWAVDPALMRRLVGLAAVDPDVAAVIASRERWRHDHAQALTARLADRRLIRPPFTTPTAVACIDAATAFTACDTIAEQTGLAHDHLDDVGLHLLSSVVKLARA